MSRHYSTYIVHCSDGSYYTGVTNDLNRRISEHNSNDFKSSYCHNRRPVKLIYSILLIDIDEAIRKKNVKKRCIVEYP